ncbi:MAG: AarF/UbiB family protein [Flavobacteriaceae bacterium]|nr:AarF/UbiB family protein [Flavobacteriaceae bacterium]MDO7581455.1 AarF/UbiB family protein [Flavobacteriaceae bacterium]MDO7592335.1 AarF/UbiB family protein [Flavobacteriaceae bacterium]MDO7599264.1 AarF/UbiB family protein [Flavobacteriaceae bacterium]MDO7603435.1 AarF/UbiB family protein [Flavobacteriaceae bacterium]
MKTLDYIPTGKLERAGKLVSTGVKIGGNYLKYIGEKITNPDEAKENFDQNNAEDIYDGLKSLKGSALKVAQMLSMEKNILPGAYVDKFSLAQFSVPPLSGPLVRKTFNQYLGSYPEEIFDNFTFESINAASIGQVHKATKGELKLAVKIQYPGVANSISSDLALVKPVATRLFNLKGKDSEKYFKEVESKLLEETDYTLELKQSREITEACSLIPNLKFPTYYADLSCDKILTMDWMEGIHLSEYTAQAIDKRETKVVGQTLWDFYMYQMHVLKRVHADPHPGNFLVDDSGALIAIDFGCIKDVPEDFYVPYFELATSEAMQDRSFFIDKITTLEILRPDDSEEDSAYITDLFHELLGVLTFPFHNDTFDFSDELFWAKVAHMSERLSQDDKLKKLNGNRGSKHFLYINRTFFGLYNLLHDLKADIVVNNYKKFI